MRSYSRGTRHHCHMEVGASAEYFQSAVLIYCMARVLASNWLASCFLLMVI